MSPLMAASADRPAVVGGALVAVAVVEGALLDEERRCRLARVGQPVGAVPHGTARV
jgi:hypothetical protein